MANVAEVEVDGADATATEAEAAATEATAVAAEVGAAQMPKTRCLVGQFCGICLSLFCRFF